MQNGDGIAAGRNLGSRKLVGIVPGREVVYPTDGMLSDALHHVLKPGFRVNAIEPGRANQTVNSGGALAAAVGAGK